MAKQEYIWLDGEFVKWADANVHMLTHSLQYGSGIFEGIRCVNTKKGPAVFRLHDHMTRLMHSVKIYGMPVDFMQKQLEQAVISTLRKNGLSEAYIRPFIFYNTVGIGLSVKGKTTSVAIAAMHFGNLYASHPSGLRCKTSSWLRINSSILPAAAKASGNYINSILASKEANDSGYDEAILLTERGMVAEGPADNIFVVQDGVLITPPKSANILLGITRDSVIKIARTEGLDVEERDIRKEELYISDEVFFTGTAAGVVPVLSVDSRAIAGGTQGPITSEITAKYNKVLHGESKDFGGWLTYTKSK